MRNDWSVSLDPATSGGERAEFRVTCTACGALHEPADAFLFWSTCVSCGDGGFRRPSPQQFHPLTEEAIARAVRATAPGSFELGYRDGTSLRVFYVGRADSDLGAVLRAWVEVPSQPPQRRASSVAPWMARSTLGTRLGTGPRDVAALGADSAYTHFAFRYAATAELAYERECRAFHDHGATAALDNRRHPAPPSGSARDCPTPC